MPVSIRQLTLYPVSKHNGQAPAAPERPPCSTAWPGRCAFLIKPTTQRPTRFATRRGDFRFAFVPLLRFDWSARGGATRTATPPHAPLHA